MSDEYLARELRAMGDEIKLRHLESQVGRPTPLYRAANRIDELERWKAEGVQVLDQWEAVYDSVKAHQRPEQLGLTKSSVVADRIEELELEVRRLKGHLEDGRVLRNADRREAVRTSEIIARLTQTRLTAISDEEWESWRTWRPER